MLNERVKQTERDLADIRKEANNYQNMLQQSQAQYTTLEKKYGKCKKMLREFQQRDRDMVSIKILIIKFLLFIRILDPISRVLSTTSSGERHGVQCTCKEAQGSNNFARARVTRHTKARRLASDPQR